MSNPVRPTVDERRQAALLGTQPAATPAGLFGVRLGNDPYVWLKRQVPTVTWGPKDRAMPFLTIDEARRAVATLGRFEPLFIEEMADASALFVGPPQASGTLLL
jgi:hypothetical protein